MHPTQRETIQIANLIRDRLHQDRARQWAGMEQQLTYVTTTVDQCAVTRRKLAKAVARRYFGAAKRLRRRAENLLNDLRIQLDTAARSVGTTPAPVPRLGDVLRELDQLADEFGSWHFDRDDQAICVLTDPIELDGLYLGPFEMRLILASFDQLRMAPPLTVIAKDPHPAGNAEHVTHPHVSDERMCAGDAVTPMASALETGRICDFFMIVRSVLTNYNPDSPYVAIEDWEGECCADCGGTIYEDDRCTCELCDQTYCNECMGMCRNCDCPTCLGCLKQCTFCDEWACRDCMKTCSDCGEACCSACLNEDFCPECHERNESDDQETEEETNEDVQATAPVGQNQPEAA